jgi:hypothetical protein
MKPLHERRRRSARETFAACRMKYRALYVDGVDMSSAATRRGNAIHLAAERYIRILWDAKLTDSSDAAQLAIEFARTHTPGLTFEEWCDCESLWARWAPDFRLDLDRFVEVESKLEWADTLLQFDRVEMVSQNRLRITDLKTHFRIPSQSSLEASYQTHFYLAAARALFPGWAHIEMVYEFIRYGVKSEPIELTPAQLDLVEQHIRETDEAMSMAEDTNTFPATGGAPCSTCTLAISCLNSQKVAHGPQEIASSLAMAERVKALGMVFLKDVVDLDGPFQYNGIEWAHRPVIERRYPAAAVVDALREAELPIPGYVSLSASSIKGITESKKKYASVAETIKALAVTRSSGTTFSGKRVDGGEDEPVKDGAE